jgi:hypothetical protein
MARLGEFRFGETRLGAAARFDVGPPPELEGCLDEIRDRQHIDVTARDQFVRRIVVDDGEGGRQDLSGATAEWSAAAVRGGSASLSDADAGVSISVSDAAAGELTLTVATDVTAGLGGGRYHHEVDVIDAAGVRRSVCEGWLHIQRATTPPSSP